MAAFLVALRPAFSGTQSLALIDAGRVDIDIIAA